MPSNSRLWKNVKTPINQHLFCMFMTKKFSKIKIFLQIFRCCGEWCPQMKTLASMYKIGGWKLPSLQKCLKNVHYIQAYPHTLILKQGKPFQNYNPNYPSHALGNRLLLLLVHYFHVSGYRCGDVSITNKSKFAQIHTIIVRKVKIQQQNIMCEEENGKLCRNS